MPPVVELTQDLIRFKSMHSRPDEIQNCIAFIEAYLVRHGIGFLRLDQNGVPTLLVLRPDGTAPVLLMSDELRFKIADVQPGNKVDLVVIRDGKEMKLTAVVDELEPEPEKGEIASPEKDIGVSIVALTAASARRYGLRTTEGLLITEVRRGSEADRENLQAGMIILEVNRKKVVTVSDFENILKKTAAGDEVILLVRQVADGGSQDFIATVKVR